MSTQWGDSTLHNTDDSLLTSSPSLLAQDNVGKPIDQNTWYFASRADNNIDFNNMNANNSKRNNGYAAAASRRLNPNTTDSFQILQTVQSRLLRHTKILESDIVRFLKENNMSDQIQSLYVNHQSTSATITFTSTLAMANFLNLDCVLRGCRIEWTPHTAPFVDVSLMTLPTEMPDDIPLRILNDYYGKVISSRRRRKECLGVHYETLTRIYRMELKKPIPPTIRIAGFPTDVIYTGQPGREKPIRKNFYDNNFPNLPIKPPNKSPANQSDDDATDCETQPPPSKRTQIYVGNLAITCSKENLIDLFGLTDRSKFTVQIPRDTKTGLPKGYAIVDIDVDLSDEIFRLNGTEFYGKELIIETSSPEKPSEEAWIDNVVPAPPIIEEKLTKTERKKRKKEKKNGNVSDTAQLAKPAKSVMIEIEATVNRNDGENSTSLDNLPQDIQQIATEESIPMDITEPSEPTPPPQTSLSSPIADDAQNPKDPFIVPPSSPADISPENMKLLKDKMLAKLFNEKDIDIPLEAIETEFLSYKAHAIYIKFKGDVDKAKKEGFATSMISVMETLKSTSCSEQHLKQGLHNYAESLAQRMNNASS